jgi:dTDP-4-amino-4,6-dideoxygalactose transaminase
LPNTDWLCERLIQLPIGALVAEGDVALICELIGDAHDQAALIAEAG